MECNLACSVRSVARSLAFLTLFWNLMLSPCSSAFFRSPVMTARLFLGIY